MGRCGRVREVRIVCGFGEVGATWWQERRGFARNLDEAGGKHGRHGESKADGHWELRDRTADRQQ